MRTKTKILALLEIAIVLCSVLLAAIPAIAADTQKVSANAITTASEDDYVLGIYGNANEDDTIDMGDVVYTKLAIFGKKPKTELCDAKYDGRINVLDVIQTKLIILGKEKELTLIDSADRIVTVKKPVERAITLVRHGAEAIRMLGVQDKIVGVSNLIKEREAYFPELSKLPSVGTASNPDLEAIYSLNPDLVNTYSFKSAGLAEHLPGITVTGLDFYCLETFREEQIKLGYIYNKEDSAWYYLDDFHDKYIDIIKARTEGLSEEERPKVYLERHGNRPYRAYSGSEAEQLMLDLAGGINIFADFKGVPVVDPEEVVVRNPDIIIRRAYEPDAGYTVGDTSKAEALRDSIMNRPELAIVTAVVDGDVYIMSGDLNKGLDYPIAVIYWAKWFHPELFEDLDPKAIHQEFLTRFHQGLNIDLDEKGVFVYHPEEHPHGN